MTKPMTKERLRDLRLLAMYVRGEYEAKTNPTAFDDDADRCADGALALLDDRAELKRKLDIAVEALEDIRQYSTDRFTTLSEVILGKTRAALSRIGAGKEDDRG